MELAALPNNIEVNDQKQQRESFEGGIFEIIGKYLGAKKEENYQKHNYRL